MNRISFWFLLFLAAALAAAALLSASTARRWLQGGRADFLKGSPESVSINSAGEIVLPPEATLLFESPQQFVWDIALDARGQLYVAGGNEGVIYDGRGNPVHDDAKPEIHALAMAPDGTLFFSTSPSGAVWRMDSGGQVEQFFLPQSSQGQERYTWDMAFARSGDLYVATGIEGRLYKVAPDGIGQIAFDSDEANITSVAIDPAGRVVFGSDPNGQIFQLDAAGNVFVLFDTPFKEVNNVVIAADGSIYATAVAVSALEPKSEEGKDAAATSDRVGASGSVAVSNSGDGNGGSNGAKSALYRIDPSGSVEMLWSSDSAIAYSLALGRNGNALVGTGPEGRLICVESDGTETVLRRLEGMQITSLRSAQGLFYAGVSNLGKVFRLSEQYAEKGEFISQVKDTGTVSAFGAVDLRAEIPAGTSINLYTRSGNTEAPDNTWSPWSLIQSQPNATFVASPAARFIQWKAELLTTEPTATPRLKSVSIYYMQSNLKPRVRSAEVLPAGVALKPATAPDPTIASMPGEVEEELKNHGINASYKPVAGQPYFERHMRTLRWSATDANNDELRFRLRYRPIESEIWTTLAENLEEHYYCFDTRRMRDGIYVVRIEAEDSQSNPPEQSLRSHLDCQPFFVDNTPPSVEQLAVTASGGEATISFLAVDESSAIKSIRIRIGSEPWRVVRPEDGISDSRRESVNITIPEQTREQLLLTVQVIDELYNIGSASTNMLTR